MSRMLRRLFRRGQQPSGSEEPLIFNEAVNFKKKVIFIAVPKTGSTTVRKQLSEKGAPLLPNPHLSIMQVRDSLYVYFLRNALGKNITFPTAAVLDDVDIRRKSQAIFENFFKFSAVRNPWARAVSLYHRREGVQLKGRISFEDFCDKHCYASDTCIHPTLHKNQLDWLCDENGNLMMDYVYKVENFNEALKEIEARTDGRLQIMDKAKNVNIESPSKNYRELYTDRTRKLIAQRFEKDIDYFKYSF